MVTKDKESECEFNNIAFLVECSNINKGMKDRLDDVVGEAEYNFELFTDYGCKEFKKDAISYFLKARKILRRRNDLYRGSVKELYLAIGNNIRLLRNDLIG